MTRMGWLGDKRQLRHLEIRKPTVFWLSDRQALVLSVMRNPETGNTYYARRQQPDLWNRFSWYEQFFRIEGFHAKRNLNAWQKMSDRMAGDGRQMLKDYYANTFFMRKTEEDE
jgi:quinol monooxygenase YgiN